MNVAGEASSEGQAAAAGIITIPPTHKLLPAFYSVPKRAKSSVWEHFRLDTRSPLHRGLREYAYCLRCAEIGVIKWVRIGSSGATTNLTNHLGTHKRTAEKLFEIDDAHAMVMVDAEVDVIARSCLPLSMHESFAYYTHALLPTSIPPSIEGVRERLLARATLASAENKAVFRDQWACLTADGWTSKAKKTYLSVTAHIITADWERLSRTLAVREVAFQAGEGIGSTLRNIAEDHGLLLVAAVTDNASNIRKACADEGYERVGCCAHTLNLLVMNKVLGDADEDCAANLLGRKVRKIIAHVSTDEQTEEGHAGTRVRLHCPTLTRWFTRYHELNEVKEKYEAISKMLPAGLCLVDSERDLLRDVVALLDLFAQAEKVFEGEGYCWAGVAVYLYERLCDEVSKCASSMHSDESRAICTAVQADLHTRVASAPAPLILATILDPRFKTVGFAPDLRETWTERFIQHVRREAPVALEVPEASTSTFSLQSTASEVDRYLAGGVDTSIHPMQWWRANGVAYPNLATLARKYLCLTATSAPSDRIFSRTRDDFTRKRSRIDGEVLEATILVGDAVRRSSKRKRSDDDPLTTNKRQKCT